MRLFERIALLLWRDRGRQDPVTETVSEDYNRSLLTRFKSWRYHSRGKRRAALAWIAPSLIGAASAIGAVLLAHYIDAGKAEQKLDVNAGELLLRCTQEADDIYRCRQVMGVQNQVVARPDGDSVDVDVPAQQSADE